jgi:hypothetical protein
MSARQVLASSLLVLLTSTCQRAVPAEHGPAACTPSFREVSDEIIQAEASYWRLYFAVALVGCRADLDLLSTEELEALKKEFTNPTAWPILLLATASKKQSFRETVRLRANTLLGRDIVTDVLIHDLTIIDHNVAREKQ